MRPLIHPAAEDITLQGVLHALADPARLEMFRRIAAHSQGVSCTASAPLDMPRSTRTFHTQVLREAGLVRSERRGTEVTNVARLDEVEARFPGLLAAILNAAGGGL